MINLKYFEIEFNIPFPQRDPHIKREAQIYEYYKKLNTFYKEEFLKISKNLNQYSIQKNLTFDENEAKENNCILVDRETYKDTKLISTTMKCKFIRKQCKLDLFRISEGQIKEMSGIYLRVVQYGSHHNSNLSKRREYILLHYISKKCSILKQKMQSVQQQEQKDIRYQEIKKNDEEETILPENQYSRNDIHKIVTSQESRPLNNIESCQEESVIQSPQDNMNNLQFINLKYEYDESNLIEILKQKTNDFKNKWIQSQDELLQRNVQLKEQELENEKLKHLLFKQTFKDGSKEDNPVILN